MNEILPSGLSIRLAWVFCTGMTASDRLAGIKLTLERIDALSKSAIETVVDIETVEELFAECDGYLRDDEFPLLRAHILRLRKSLVPKAAE